MNRNELLDYLYGEMDEVSRKEFETILEKDADLQKEWEELRYVRSMLGRSVDVHPTGTPIIYNERKPAGNSFYKKLLAVAASLLILLFAGYLADFRLIVENNSVLMTFGEQPSHNPVWQDLASTELMTQRELISSELEAMKNEMIGSMSDQQGNSEVELPVLKQELASLGNRVKRENQIWTANLIQDVTEQQDAKTEALLNQLLLYIDQRRKEDMEFVKTGFDQVVRSIYEQNPYQPLALSTISQ